MIEHHISFAVPKAMRAGLSQAVRAEARGVAPFRHQQLTFDTADGLCVERGLYLLADSTETEDAERVHRVVQLVSASAARENVWPDSRRQFDIAHLQQLLASASPGFGPPLEQVPVLLPRARIVIRGRRGLIHSGGETGSVVEVVNQRCEIHTAVDALAITRLTLSLVSGPVDGLFALAQQWQQRFDLVIDPHPHYVQAARLAAAKRRRPSRFGAPVWQEGRQLADSAAYPLVGEAGLLTAAISDCLINTCAIAEGDADEHRLRAFEDGLHSIGCLLGQRNDAVPESVTAPLQRMLNRRSEASAIKWLERALQDQMSVNTPDVARLLAAARRSGPPSLRALAIERQTRTWLLDLLAWSACTDGVTGPGHDAPSLAGQNACRQRLESRLEKARADAIDALAEDLPRRAQLWHDLSQFDEALTLFGSILPRRLMLRYRMIARAALGPLTDWLTISRAIERAPDHIEDARLSETLLSQWRSERQAANERVVTQLNRLSHAASAGVSSGLPVL